MSGAIPRESLKPMSAPLPSSSPPSSALAMCSWPRQDATDSADGPTLLTRSSGAPAASSSRTRCSSLQPSRAARASGASGGGRGADVHAAELVRFHS